ncbi:hypothetical protein EAI90_13690 [Faecalibacterium prausnitzii]|nr:hypothetical protein EAI90_13690 [Faecalibacterium prausnitzii]
MVKFHSSPVVVDETSTAIQIIMGVPTDSVLLCQRFGTEAAVRLGLVQCHNALLAAHKSRTVLTQFVLNFSLRQNKSGGRFFALRLVDFFNLFSFGGDVSIKET